MKTSSKLVVLFFALLVVALDQLTKSLVMQYIKPGQIVPLVSGLLNLTLTFNRGAAFGLLAEAPEGYRQVLIAALTGMALLVVLWLLVRDYKEHLLAQFALAIVIGGAFGNIIDRVRLGHVIDFIDAYFQSYHWPAFNVADSAICIGVVLLFIVSFFTKPAPLKLPPRAIDKVRESRL